ncbi:MAG: Asp-tRNA(Asn)/Glu-tRNA(Gln) amidotransferase subunit GatC [Planctomycetota bacterium]
MSDSAPDSARLDDDAVRHVAKLARLAIDDADVHGIAEQLTGILTYVSKIAEVDTTGVEPVAHAVPIENVLRDDTVGPMLTVEQALQNAPDREPPFFKVPKVIGGDEDSAG